MPRKVTENTAWDDCYNTVAYTADALRLAGDDGDKEVGALAARVDEQCTAWESLDVEKRQKRRAVGRSHAFVKRRDIQADTTVTGLHNDALGHAKQDRSHPVFARLFSGPLSSIVRLSLGSQLSPMRSLLLKVEEPETPAPIKKVHAKPLADVIEKGEAAIKAREEAFAAAGRTAARIATWRDDVNMVLLGVEGALKTIAAHRKLNQEWVDSFFPTVSSPKSKPKSEPTSPSTV